MAAGLPGRVPLSRPVDRVAERCLRLRAGKALPAERVVSAVNDFQRG